MEWESLPRELKIISFKDFCIRCEEIYDLFWEFFAPFFDITIYRDYLLYSVEFNCHAHMQERLAGIVWEYLMGDIDADELIGIWHDFKK